MKYEGTVYGKVNGRYIVLTETVKQLEDKNKELIEEIIDLKTQLNDDGEMPVVNIPVETTRYRLNRIVEGSDHSGENMTDKNQ